MLVFFSNRRKERILNPGFLAYSFLLLALKEMWKLFKEFGTYGGLYGTLFLVAATATHLLPLDPITCAGGIAVVTLRNAIGTNPALAFTLPALVMITQDLMLDTWLRQRPERDETATPEKWLPHLNYLVKCGILLKWNAHAMKFFGSYFAVPKSESHARAIWNGKKLSSFCRPPPPVNLPYLPDLLTRLARLTHQHKRPPTVIVQDWSSFFHQIPVSQEMSEFFGVRTGWSEDHVWRWRTLPMGTTFSPWVAQSVGWGVVLHKEKTRRTYSFFPRTSTPCLRMCP